MAAGECVEKARYIVSNEILKPNAEEVIGFRKSMDFNQMRRARTIMRRKR